MSWPLFVGSYLLSFVSLFVQRLVVPKYVRSFVRPSVRPEFTSHFIRPRFGFTIWFYDVQLKAALTELDDCFVVRLPSLFSHLSIFKSLYDSSG